MPILSFNEFNVNEDATSDLIQQKNSLAQQINDLQKKLLDVQQQIVVAQKQTLAQNPQSQIPMGEAMEHGSLPQGSHIVHADYYFPRKELYVRFSIPGQEEHGEVEANVDDFEDFLDDEASQLEPEEIKHYQSKEYDGDSHYIHFNMERFWDETDQHDKNRIIHQYLVKNNSIA